MMMSPWMPLLATESNFKWTNEQAKISTNASSIGRNGILYAQRITYSCSGTNVCILCKLSVFCFYGCFVNVML
ncbi:hypothetical protein LINGRAPRIM_LOCUS1876 [Linum grandiflorum]